MRRHSRVIDVLRKGGVVAVPTDTVYGLVSDARNPDAVQRIYEVKRRPKDKPLVLFPHHSMDLREVAEIGDDARKLIDAFWPGALTVVLKATGSAPGLLVSRGKIGMRVPRHPLLEDLLSELEFPLASTSANISGSPPLHTKEEVEKYLGGRIDLIVGERALGQLPSTVIDLSGERPIVLRKGAISLRDIESVLGKDVLLSGEQSFTLLFLCTGNTCRSPMAEYIFKSKLPSELRDKVRVISAGISPPMGSGINPEAERVLKELGISGAAHRTRSLTPNLIEEADLILGMENFHVSFAVELGAGSKALLFGADRYEEVPDPIGSDVEFYRNVRDMIVEVIERIWLPYVLRKFSVS